MDLRTEKGVIHMLAVKSMDVRDNFKNFCEKVINGETLIISRPKNENVVMLSEAEYNKMMKAKRNADYLAMLDKSMAEAESGGFIPKTISELETFE
jgi:antitoxin YefM